MNLGPAFVLGVKNISIYERAAMSACEMSALIWEPLLPEQTTASFIVAAQYVNDPASGRSGIIPEVEGRRL